MSRRRSARETISLGAEAASVWFRHNLVEPLRSQPGLPRAMDYISTHRCNARCVMCGIWKETGTRAEELSPEALSGILGDRLFSRMEFVGISGGEPFLRDDLAELSAAVLEKCPTVKRLSLTTNGLLTQRIRSVLPEIANRARGVDALLDVSVSVHGMGETLAGIYGVADAFGKIEQTIGVLEELRDEGHLSFSMNCVLGERRLRCRTEWLDEAFVDLDGQKPLIDFLRSLVEDPSQSAPSAGKYRELAAMLEGRKTRCLSCHYAMGGLLLGHDGRLYYCSHSKDIGSCGDRPPLEIYYDPSNLEFRKRDLQQAECRHCPPYTRTRWEIEKDLPRTLLEMTRHRFGRIGQKT
jgi:MoaA/NifB/PqqE/SkfB family radical SAM enzyme